MDKPIFFHAPAWAIYEVQASARIRIFGFTSSSKAITLQKCVTVANRSKIPVYIVYIVEPQEKQGQPETARLSSQTRQYRCCKTTSAPSVE